VSEPERDWRRACFPTFLRGRDWLADSPPVRWVKRSWWRAVKWALVILLVLGIIHTAVLVHASSRLAAKLDALRAAGKLADGPFADAPSVPEHENAAPLYAAAAAWVRLHERAGGWDPSVPAGSQSGLRAGYGDLFTRDGEPRALSAEEFESVKRTVALDRPALSLIRQGAARPHCRSKGDRGSPFLPDPHVPDLHQLRRFLAANVLVAARSGQSELALDSLRLGFVVGRHGSEAPTVVGGLGFARGTAHTMMVLTAHLLPRLHLADADTKAFAEELARVNLGATLPERWDDERVAGLRMFGSVRGSESERRALEPQHAPLPRLLQPWFWRHYGGGVLGPWLELDKIEYLEEMDRWEPILTGSARERAEAWQAIPRSNTPSGPWWAPMTRNTAWSPVGWARTMDCWDVSCDLLRIVLGLERYRQQHGGYPTSLGQLRASGWDVPKDRFSETEFAYQQRGTTFLLYSIGPNLRDDGGQPSEWPFFSWRKVEPGQGPKGDIVWEYRPVMRRRSPRR